jgi:alcohol dehydrogenase YqhD (iron-dependent ADH family)
MADLTTPQGCVNAAVEAFSKAEVRAQGAINAALQLPNIFEAGNQLLMADMGNLKTGLMKAQAQEAAGKIAAGLADLWALHRVGTDIAIANGLDLAQPLSGPGR